MSRTNRTVAAATTNPKRHHLDCRVQDIVGRAPGEKDDDLLSTRAVADWLGVSVVWLEIGRSRGYGPKFVRLSPRRIRYRRDAVLKFLNQRTHARTTEYAARAGA